MNRSKKENFSRATALGHMSPTATKPTNCARMMDINHETSCVENRLGPRVSAEDVCSRKNEQNNAGKFHEFVTKAAKPLMDEMSS